MKILVHLPLYHWLENLKMAPFRAHQNAWNVQPWSRPCGGVGVGVGVQSRRAGQWRRLNPWVRDEDTCTPEGSCRSSSCGRLGTDSQTYTLSGAERGSVSL